MTKSDNRYLCLLIDYYIYIGDDPALDSLGEFSVDVGLINNKNCLQITSDRSLAKKIKKFLISVDLGSYFDFDNLLDYNNLYNSRYNISIPITKDVPKNVVKAILSKDDSVNLAETLKPGDVIRYQGKPIIILEVGKKIIHYEARKHNSTEIGLYSNEDYKWDYEYSLNDKMSLEKNDRIDMIKDVFKA